MRRADIRTWFIRLVLLALASAAPTPFRCRRWATALSIIWRSC
jgi:hypothetical protein